MEAQDERSVPASHITPSPGALTGLRVIELADEQAEYCGLALAGLGAEVIKVEPPGGSPTRRIGPFYEDREDPERSLFFWQYNRGKRSIMLDLRQPADRDQFRTSLVATADVLLESTPRRTDGLGLGADTLMQQFHAHCGAHVLLGDYGPWADFKRFRPDTPGTRGRHDELWLRSGPRRAIRSAADSPPDVARLPHCGRAACHGDHRGAALSLAHGPGAVPVVLFTRQWRNAPRSTS